VSRATRRPVLGAVLSLFVGAAVIACSGTPATSAPTATVPVSTATATAGASPTASAAAGKLKVFGAYATQIEEPWDGVIHKALQAQADAGKIDYSYSDDLGYSGDMERELLQVSQGADAPDVIFGDAFGNEEAVRRVASQFPGIAFVFGSGGGPADPNLSVFDNWIHEPAYLAGMLAGGLTKSNVIGVVGGYPVPEVNRITNAFIAGAQATNPEVQVKVSFINSWFNPDDAKEAAIAQADAGADVFYAERFGVIEAAQQKNGLAVGNMSDQKDLAPQNVVTSVVWDMAPTVDYVLDQVQAGSYTAQDLKDFSMFAKGGASLAEINTGITGGVPQELLDKVTAKENEIRSGIFRVDINENTPAGAVIPSTSP